jgi:hypothetical protein
MPVGVWMSEQAIVSIVHELESLGVKLTVTPRLDGSLRLNCWRSMNSWQYRSRINELLAEHVDNAPNRAAEIAKFISERLTGSIET